MNDVRILKQIITKEESEFFINYINKNLDLFDNYAHDNNPERYALRFGIDNVYVGNVEGRSHHTLELVSDIHDKLRDLFSKVTTEVEDVYGSEKNLYVTSFHMGKQLPSSVVGMHLDADPDHNGHFKYSCVIYLNTNTSGGSIEFPVLGYSYQPKELEAVVFPSQGFEYQHEVSDIRETRYCLPLWITEDPEWEIKFA